MKNLKEKLIVLSMNRAILVLGVILICICCKNDSHKIKPPFMNELQCFKIHSNDGEFVTDSIICYGYKHIDNHYLYTERYNDNIKIFDYHIEGRNIKDCDSSYVFWLYIDSINLSKHEVIHFFNMVYVGSTRESKIFFFDGNYNLVGLYMKNYNIVHTNYANYLDTILIVAKNFKKRIIQDDLQYIDTTEILQKHDLLFP